MRILAETIDMPVNLNKNLLREIICIIVIDYHFANVPVHPLLILANKQIEPVISGFRIPDLT